MPRVERRKQVRKGSDLLVSAFVEDDETAEGINELHSESYSELQEHSTRPRAERVDPFPRRAGLRGLVRHKRQGRGARTLHERARG